MRKTRAPFIIFVAILLGVGSYFLSNRYYSRANKLQANNENGSKTEVEPIKFQSFYSNELNNIHKLRMSNSEDGLSLETTYQSKIKEVIDLMNGVTFILEDDQEESEGTTYYVDLIENEEENKWFRIIFPRVKFINYSPDGEVTSSEYYKMNNSDEIMKKIDEIYKALK